MTTQPQDSMEYGLTSSGDVAVGPVNDAAFETSVDPARIAASNPQSGPMSDNMFSEAPSVSVPRPSDSELVLTADREGDVIDDGDGPVAELQAPECPPPAQPVAIVKEEDGLSRDAALESVRGTIVSGALHKELRRIDEFRQASLQQQNPLEAIEGCLFGFHQEITSVVARALADKMQHSADPLATMVEHKPQLELYLRLKHEGEKSANMLIRLTQQSQPSPTKERRKS